MNNKKFLLAMLATVCIFSAAIGAGCRNDDGEGNSQSFNSSSEIEESSSIDGDSSSDSGDSSVVTPKTYTVTFNSDGGTAVDSATVQEGGKVTKPTNPTKADDTYRYTFIGWYNGETAWNFNTNVITDNITLTAKYTKVKLFTITFETNGGSAIESKKVIAGTDLTNMDTEYVTTKDGMVFDGWYMDADYSAGTRFGTDILEMPESLPGDAHELTAYAKWIEVGTITFNSDGGTEISPLVVEKNTLATKPTDPTKTASVDGKICLFLGWYKADDTLWNFETDVVTEDITLTAKWTEKKLPTFMGTVMDTTVVSCTNESESWVSSIDTNVADTEMGEETSVKVSGENSVTVAFATLLENKGNYDYWEFRIYVESALEGFCCFKNTGITLNAGWNTITFFDAAEFENSNIWVAGGTFWLGSFKGYEYPELPAFIDGTMDATKIGGDSVWSINTIDTYIATGDVSSLKVSNLGNVGFNYEQMLPATAPAYDYYEWKIYSTVAVNNAFCIGSGVFSLVEGWNTVRLTYEQLTAGNKVIWYENNGHSFYLGSLKGGMNPVINEYTVTFNSDGGTTVAPLTVEEDTLATKPTDPTKTATDNGKICIFLGWYKADDTLWNFETDVVTGDVTLTAKWAEKKLPTFMETAMDTTVIICKNESESWVSSIDASIADTEMGEEASVKVSGENSISVDFAALLENKGSYDYWEFRIYVASDLEGFCCFKNSGITLKAGWNTITFLNASEFENSNIWVAGGTFWLGSFRGCTYPELPVFIDGTMDATKIGGDSVWSINTIDTYIATGDVSSLKVSNLGNVGFNYEQMLPATAPAYDYYEWKIYSTVAVNNAFCIGSGVFSLEEGWNTVRLTYEQLTAGNKVIWYENNGHLFYLGSLKGGMNPVINEYTVTFNSDGGTTVAPLTVEEGALATKPADPTKTASVEGKVCIFLGWYKADDTLWNFETDVVTEDITLTAKWTEKKLPTFMGTVMDTTVVSCTNESESWVSSIDTNVADTEMGEETSVKVSGENSVTVAFATLLENKGNYDYWEFRIYVESDLGGFCCFKNTGITLNAGWNTITFFDAAEFENSNVWVAGGTFWLGSFKGYTYPTFIDEKLDMSKLTVGYGTVNMAINSDDTYIAEGDVCSIKLVYATAANVKYEQLLPETAPAYDFYVWKIYSEIEGDIVIGNKTVSMAKGWNEVTLAYAELTAAKEIYTNGGTLYLGSLKGYAYPDFIDGKLDTSKLTVGYGEVNIAINSDSTYIASEGECSVKLVYAVPSTVKYDALLPETAPTYDSYVWKIYSEIEGDIVIGNKTVTMVKGWNEVTLTYAELTAAKEIYTNGGTLYLGSLKGISDPIE